MSMYVAEMTITPDLAARFWTFVDRSDGCWLWTGSRSAKGYGRFGVNRKNRNAHRVAWLIAHGDLPPGLYVCHHCDNPPCVRPDHLYLGTCSQNMIDASRRNRLPHAKLDILTVPAIRAELASGLAIKAIARKHGVNGRTIRRIRSGESWAHVA